MVVVRGHAVFFPQCNLAAEPHEFCVNLLPGDEEGARRAGGQAKTLEVNAGQGEGLGAGCEIQGCRRPTWQRKPLVRKMCGNRTAPIRAPATAFSRWGGQQAPEDSVGELGSAHALLLARRVRSDQECSLPGHLPSSGIPHGRGDDRRLAHRSGRSNSDIACKGVV